MYEYHIYVDNILGCYIAISMDRDHFQFIPRRSLILIATNTKNDYILYIYKKRRKKRKFKRVAYIRILGNVLSGLIKILESGLSQE